jgi:hypothetical protein
VFGTGAFWRTDGLGSAVANFKPPDISIGKMSGFRGDQGAETTAVSVLRSVGDRGKARPMRGGGCTAKRRRRRDPGKMVRWSAYGRASRRGRWQHKLPLCALVEGDPSSVTLARKRASLALFNA